MEKLQQQVDELLAQLKVGEGQLHLNRENISEFAKFEVKGPDLLRAIEDASFRQISK